MGSMEPVVSGDSRDVVGYQNTQWKHTEDELNSGRVQSNHLNECAETFCACYIKMYSCIAKQHDVIQQAVVFIFEFFVVNME